MSFSSCRFQSEFLQFGYHCVKKIAGVQRGISPWLWVSNRGEKHPCWHTILFAKSSVLYLCFRLTLERGWLRHLRHRQIEADRRFSAAVRHRVAERSGKIMEKGQFAILRFAKYKGPEIGRIEAHNERTKEEYASNPDIDTSRSHLNFHLIKPERKYRAESERQIAAAGCRTRSDSVRVVEALITASPEFFKGKKRADIKEFFNEALEFIRQNQSPETIISAVVHMDEKTPHMHLSFVPLTEDKRLCAKEILGNRKKMTQWQDKFWEHMVKKYPVLERGESASETGRDHIPPRVFKQMTRLTKQMEKLDAMLSDVKFTNYKERTAQIAAFLEEYIPDVAAMETQMKKYQRCFTTAESEKKALKKKNDDLTEALEKIQQQSTVKKLQEARLQSDYERVKGILDRIPPEIIRAYTQRGSKKQEVNHYSGLE